MEELKKHRFRDAGTAERIVRIIMVLIGIVFLALGISIFKLSLLGNDPYTGMLFAISDVTGFPYAWLQVLMGVVFFVFQFIFGRHLIGFGTIYNAFCIGFVVDFFNHIFEQNIGELSGFPIRVLVLFIGMLICSLGISLYQQADLGVSPYDSMSLILAERQKRFAYFWCRILTDGICAIVCFLLGGIVGLGTIVTAFGFGPFVTFYNHLVSDPLLRLARKKDGTVD